MVAMACACSGSSSAEPAFDAGACQAGRPGVRVVFVPTGSVGPYAQSTLTVTIGAEVGRHQPGAAGFEVDDAGVPSTRLPYPAGAAAGPGMVDYHYAGPGAFDTKGHADFQADLAACVTVPMELVYLDFDAGVPDAAP
jgi:hypothetical protein